MSMMRSTHPTSFDAELDGRDVVIAFDRVTAWSSGWEGQDADGRRGVWMTMIDEDDAEAIVVTSWSGPDGARETTTPLAALTSLQALEVQRLVDIYLETHAPQAPEEEGPDYDDVDD